MSKSRRILGGMGNQTRYLMEVELRTNDRGESSLYLRCPRPGRLISIKTKENEQLYQPQRFHSVHVHYNENGRVLISHYNSNGKKIWSDVMKSVGTLVSPHFSALKGFVRVSSFVMASIIRHPIKPNRPGKDWLFDLSKFDDEHKLVLAVFFGCFDSFTEANRHFTEIEKQISAEAGLCDSFISQDDECESYWFGIFLYPAGQSNKDKINYLFIHQQEAAV